MQNGPVTFRKVRKCQELFLLQEFPLNLAYPPLNYLTFIFKLQEITHDPLNRISVVRARQSIYTNKDLFCLCACHGYWGYSNVLSLQVMF